MPYADHLDAARGQTGRCAIITLSDTRTESTDTSGARIRTLLTGAGHAVAHYAILPDDPALLGLELARLLDRDDIDVILTNGGTGISRRDQTIGVLDKLIEQPLSGFGELFRMLSWNEIGSGAMLSRATAGIGRGKLLFAMPGSTPAVELAMTKLILPELRHLLHELRK
jgi:molybdenum cofactor biosynthesis protein B